MKNFIFILFIIIYSCGSTKIENFNSDKIIGKWCASSNEGNYPSLTFKENGYAVFDSKIDTIYFFAYTLKENYLTILPLNEPDNRNRVLKLTNDTLILESLLENKYVQVFSRCKR